MSRGTPSAVTTPYRSEGPDPLLLVHIETGGTPADLRYTSWEAAVEMGGVTWSPRPLELDDTRLEAHTEAGSTDLRIGDGDGYFQTLVAAGVDLTNQRVRLYRTSGAALGSGQPLTDAIRDDWYVESWDRVHGVVVLHLRPLLSIFDIDVPRTTVTRAEFPGIPDGQAV